MRANAEWILETKTPERVWKYLDSSVLEALRRAKIPPLSVLEDIKVLSYNDLLRKLKLKKEW